MLESYVVPNFLQKEILRDNYRNENVVALLKAIDSNKKISKNFHKMIANVLDGE